MESSPAPNPYQAPVESAEPPVVGTASPGFVDQSTLVTLLTGLLGLQAIVAGGNAAACVALNVATLDFDAETFLVTTTNQAASFDVWLYWATLVPFGMFLFRANKNARAISGKAPTFTPASMVWWYAVPFMNLIRPYQAVLEVWDLSTLSETLPVRSGVLPAWWAAWLLGTISPRITAALTVDAEPFFHNNVAAFENTTSLALCVLAATVVRQLDARQRRATTGTSPEAVPGEPSSVSSAVGSVE